MERKKDKMVAKDEKLIKNMNDLFSIEVKGLSYSESELKRLKKFWMSVTYTRKQKRDYLKQILPKIDRLNKKYNKDLKEFLSKEGRSFLKKFKV